MKATVWTCWSSKAIGSTGQPKCIFDGEIQSIPRVGEYIVVRDGFCCETVRQVTHNLINGTIEITIGDSDDDNEYGPSLKD